MMVLGVRFNDFVRFVPFCGSVLFVPFVAQFIRRSKISL